MKRILFTGFLVVFSTLLFAQQWETDFATAKAKAEQQGKNIVLNFCGSDWCIPCIKLEKTIWDSFEFKDYAKSHYILLRADFPKKKADALSKEQQEKNDRLADEFLKTITNKTLNNHAKIKEIKLNPPSGNLIFDLQSSGGINLFIPTLIFILVFIIQNFS